jgi:hypothetical protein
LEKAVSRLDETQVNAFLIYLNSQNVVLDKACCDTAIRKMAEVGWKDRKSFEALLSMIRIQV